MNGRGQLVRWMVAVGAVALAGVAALAAVSQAATSGARVSAHSSQYGTVLFGPNGKALYAFGADNTPHSTCYGACAAAWPPLLTTASPTAGAGARAGLLGTTKRKDGRLQVTYKGHPLYYYSADEVGQVGCQHVNANGGVWLAVRPSGVLDTATHK